MIKIQSFGGVGIEMIFFISIMSRALDLITKSRLACALGNEAFGWVKPFSGTPGRPSATCPPREAGFRM